MQRTVFALAACLAVALSGVAAQGSITDELRQFASLNLWTEVNSTANTIFQTCRQQQLALNQTASGIGANCTINGSCTAFNCTARDGTTRLTVSSNVCVPSLSRRISGNGDLSAAIGNFSLNGFDPINSWQAAQQNAATGTGFYNITGTLGNQTINNFIYIPAQFCTPDNRAFRVGVSWRANVDDRITPDMNWTQAIDLQIANAKAGNVSGACTDITPMNGYRSFTCNVPASNGSTPLSGVSGPITAGIQPCQREYYVTIAGKNYWFSPAARVNYTVPGTSRTAANLTRGQGARVSGGNVNYTNAPTGGVPKGPQGPIPLFQQVNPNVIKWTYGLFYNTSNVSFAAYTIYGPADACGWANGISSNAVAGLVTAGILCMGLVFVVLFAIFGRFL